MKLKLTKPLCFFDIEATGSDIVSDRIVEIAVEKVLPDGTSEHFHSRINPEKPIPDEISQIHGIYDEDVATAPRFADIADDLYAFFADSDLAGFHLSRLDVPLLVEEFLRVGKVFVLKGRRRVDIQRIFHLMEKRDLKSAYKFYCKKELEDAHSAEADVAATREILDAQMDRYQELENDIDFIDKFASEGDFIDTARRLINVGGRPAFNFGKYKGKYVSDVLQRDPAYYSWIQNSRFALDTKQKLKEIKLSLGPKT